jgi:nucleotide-binding universal stress UspA family protein
VLTVRRVEHRPESSKIERIVCPFNYSAVAMKAFRHAMLLASGLDAELTVLSLEETDWNGDLEGEATRLKDWISDIPLSIRATFLVRHGEAATQVNDFALHHGTDLIVMGAQKRRDGNTTVIGTTTEKLTRHAPCPVLTVPADDVAAVYGHTQVEAGETVEGRY